MATPSVMATLAPELMEAGGASPVAGEKLVDASTPSTNEPSTAGTPSTDELSLTPSSAGSGARGDPLLPRRLDLSGESLGDAKAARRRVGWSAFSLVIPVFMGYAALFSLQHQVKGVYGISDNLSPESRFFTASTSLLYLGNLCFRLGHTLLARWVSPRGRVYLALGAMTGSMAVLASVFMVADPWLGCVPIAYGLGGLAVGTFEANLLATLSPLEGAKRYAVAAIPVGITIITIGAFLALGAGLPIIAIYGTVCVACFGGMLILRYKIPDTTRELRGHASLQKNLGHWREWLPQMASLPLVFTVDMFCVSTFSPGVLLFVYNKATVDMSIGSYAGELPTDQFFALYNLSTFIGGFLGRNAGYWMPARHPVWFLPLHLVGVSLIFTKSACWQLLAGFFILLGDGLVYSNTCRQIDLRVPTRYHVVAMSVWLFVGDVGSVCGSNLILVMRQLLVS